MTITLRGKCGTIIVLYFKFNTIHREHSVTYYKQAGSIEKAIEGSFMLEDYEELVKISNNLPDNSPLLEVHVRICKLHLWLWLQNVAEKLRIVGLCKPAVSAYIKVCGNYFKWYCSLSG